ncbi:amidohydrolase [Blastococcus sp. CT_GayMR20]|uniref:amidohydrolase family protein n=1 Tax=Blastococcus sp. CT_GayMR20 TaxID=2559609 RepID=UPI00107381AC|nr:amidohydrolase family protein [Blastococcus sp. CT_GayMR20]TFV93794.1 amidohydrolase [Blastococcus sp. CT_GayMR20]TFV93801.1 amidohydrolase [Blastococcus sp. CT_GayMR20]
MVVDAHVHVWDLQAHDHGWMPPDAPIRRDFGLDDLRSAVAGTEVSSVVLVQVINDADETRVFLEHARSEELVAGVIGWIDLARPDVDEALGALAGDPALVGIRHQALAETDPAGWLRSDAVQRGLEALDALGLPFDLMIRPEHFPAAVESARAHPSLRFVLDHLGKAPIASGQVEPWATGLRALAAEPNVWCKLSGIHTIAAPGATYADLAPFADVAMEAFTPARVVFGSDWPVSLQRASYADVVQTAARACAALAPAERSAVLRGNAREVYGLDQLQSTRSSMRAG